ncbi:MAG: PspC domain-containing protein [Bacteroidales bacterium]|nr:PspC domain-containing protein [Bacteroidales bacterium]
MKETIQLSLGGYAFIFEKDAADALEGYLKTLETHYLKQEGGKEIMEGIEERMAELLQEKTDRGTVVTLSGVQAVIDILGKPERIEADDPEPEVGEKSAKRLYRDMSDKRLGGVCSGLAQYFGIETAWLRIGFVVTAAVTFFSGAHHGMWSLIVPFVYCILWIAMPAARTAQERWAMKGDPATADDIRRNVQSGIQEMGNTAREAVHSDFFQRFGKWILVLVGIVLLIMGTSGLASVSVLSLKGEDLFGVQINQWLDELAAEAPVLYDLLSTPWVVALAALAVILPFVAILYGGIMLIFGFKSPSWRPGLVLFVLWLIDIIVLLVLVIAGAASSDMLNFV